VHLGQHLVTSQRERLRANLGAVSIERQVIQRNGYAYASDEVFQRSHGKRVWNTIANCRLAEIVNVCIRLFSGTDKKSEMKPSQLNAASVDCRELRPGAARRSEELRQRIGVPKADITLLIRSPRRRD
jgi:hypothetical protein